jgi:hypothetical protein
MVAVAYVLGKDNGVLTWRRHDSRDYDALPHIDSAGTADLSAEDQECLNAIGRELHERSGADRFGILLLHKHFDFANDETCVETVDPDRRCIVAQPVRNVLDGLAVTRLLFEAEAAGTSQFRCVALEMASPEMLGEAAPMASEDAGTLEAIAGILARRDKLERFGVQLLHDPIGLEDEILVETCDPIARTLVCSPVPQSEAERPGAINTVFRWKNRCAPDGFFASQQCVPWQKCYRDTDQNNNPVGPHQVVKGHSKS